jgi:hypothetical protein
MEESWCKARRSKPQLLRETTDAVMFEKCNSADQRDHTWCTGDQCVAILLAYQNCGLGSRCDIDGCYLRHETEKKVEVSK